MPRGSYTPNENLLSVLQEQGAEPYRIIEIRNAYIERFSPEQSKPTLRTWIYGQLRTLIKHGYINVANDVQGRNRTYTNIIKRDKQNDDAFTESISLLATLQKRLEDTKLELLTCAGETEEYEALSRLYPRIKSQLQSKFNLAKESNIKLMGKVRALESFMGEFRQQEI